MGRASVILAIAACAASGCLLYTDPINAPPRVETMIGPAEVSVRERARFEAIASDPDGDLPQLFWAKVGKRCAEADAADWRAAGERAGVGFDVVPQDRTPFCVRVRAVDDSGASVTAPLKDVIVKNRPPIPALAIDPPPTAPLPLYSRVRISARGSIDPDEDDNVGVEFTVRDPAGMGVVLAPCGPAADPLERCFEAEAPGVYGVEVIASDGRPAQEPASKRAAIMVAPDQAPCLALTDPALHTPSLVIGPGQSRRFEVRQVVDDGHAFPAGRLGAPTFHWFIAEEGAAWQRQSDGPSHLQVSEALLDNVRPGAKLAVRVEVRDPARSSPAGIAALDATCGKEPLCQQPPGCVRWASWTVEFR